MVEWKLLEGSTLAGKYVLQRFADSDERGGRYVAADPQGAPVMAHIVPADAPLADAVETSWELARSLPQKHLLTVVDAGRTVHLDVPVVYAATELPDDVLANVLPDRALTIEEARALLAAAVPALRHLHVQGVTHGNVSPTSIMAVGDTIKLTVNSLRRGGTPEADMSALAMALYEVLTRERDPRFPRLAELPSDVSSFIRRNFVAEAPASAAPARVDPPVVATAVRAAEHTAEPAPEAAAPDRHTRPLAANHAPPDTVVAPPLKIPKVVFGVAGAALLLIAYLFLHKPAPETTAPAVASPPPAVAAAPAAAPPAAHVPEEGRVWRLVLYTYSQPELAQKMVKQLRRRHNSWQPEVFNPEKGVYMVTLGGRMTKEDAQRFKSRVQGKGIPSDAFIRNYR